MAACYYSKMLGKQGSETKRQVPEERFLLGVKPWVEALKKAGVYEKLSPCNDIKTEKVAPSPSSGFNLVLRNINLDGEICDIYHLDIDEKGVRIRKYNYGRVYIHRKEIRGD